MGSFQVDELKFELTKRRGCVAELEIHLTSTEFYLLSILVRNADFVVTYRQLLVKV
jgi:two-component system, OmpR family, KDP operon response regulator KdpE